MPTFRASPILGGGALRVPPKDVMQLLADYFDAERLLEMRRMTTSPRSALVEQALQLSLQCAEARLAARIDNCFGGHVLLPDGRIVETHHVRQGGEIMHIWITVRWAGGPAVNRHGS
jgi:hypothetical protein